MKIKQLLRHTTILLRTALLLGAIAFVNVQRTEAQTAEQLAAMPNAFNTADPTTIIGNGQYYYIQFYETGIQSYLTDCGIGEKALSKDFLPSDNRLWTLVSVGASNQFKLKSKKGHYLGHFHFNSTNNNRYGCVANFADATTFIANKNGDGYDLSPIDNLSMAMYRPSHNEWTDLTIINHDKHRNSVCRLRFVQLKDNASFIIYYRGEGTDNSNPGAATTRHYLTYSGTAASSLGDNWWSSVVSSQQSVLPSDMALCTLPTLAAYHKDGLWKLEKADVEGQFYIKRYDDGTYLNKHNHNGIYDCELGPTHTDVYTLETPDANRYTRIRNVAYDNTTLYHDGLGDMFKMWENYGKDKGNGSSTTIDNNIGQSVEAGATIIGTGNVHHLIYADLSDYQKMTINGTQGMELRVLMSRQESNNGPLVEKVVTIGSDGKTVVDLTDLHLRNFSSQQLQPQTGGAEVKMTYINGSDGGTTDGDGNYHAYRETPNGVVTTAYCGYNKISNDGNDLVNLAYSDWGVNNIAYLQVDARNIHGTITKVTLTGKFQQISAREMIYGVGYNDSEWSADLTWNTANRYITKLKTTINDEEKETQTVPSSNSPEDQTLSFDITEAFTSDKIKTILVYNLKAGAGYITSPEVTVEYIPDVSDVIIDYAHLNTIKTNTAGTVNSITLSKEKAKDNTSTLYLHHAEGDGWQALQKPENDARGQHWYAGIYPVELPESEKDEIYRVLLGIKPVQTHKRIPLTGTIGMTVSNPTYDDNSNLYGATFTPTAAYQNAFQHRNLNTGSYQQIVIKFGSEVPDGWQIHTYGAQFDNLVDLKGKTEYVITLQPSRAMEDFTIFNTYASASPITITEIYYTPDLPEEMINYSGYASPYSELEDDRILWELEQIKVDDLHFRYRLKNPYNGTYLMPKDQYGTPQGVTTDLEQAETYTNEELIEKFYMKWYLPMQKEIDVHDREILHRESYLREYSDNYPELELGKQGLVSDQDSDWRNADGTQKTNLFEITHFIKKDASYDMEFPTVLNGNNDHRYYQRFFNWDEDGNETFDAVRLKNHLNLNVDGSLQYYLYKNGIVTGEKLYWPDLTTLKHSVQSRVRYTNTDGKDMTVVADVSRYSDYQYEDEAAPLDGDLTEPSLTMRYVFYMNDAKDMANRLTACTEETGKWLEEKIFHFPSKRIFYNKSKWVGYRGQFIPIRHVFSDYWVYNDPQFIKKENGEVVYDAKGKVVLDSAYIYGKSGAKNKAELEAYLDNQLVSAVIDNNGGRIVVELEDKYDGDNKTGIRLGGWNPVLAASHGGNLRFVQPEFTAEEEAGFTGYYFYDKMYNKTNYGNSRFMAFRYPSSDNGVKAVVNIGGKDVINEAYLNMYLVDDTDPDPQKHKRYRLARFTLIFDPDTETLPWTSVNGSAQVKDNTKRDPRSLVQLAGKPIARVTFDYPAGTPDTYQYPTVGSTLHNQHEEEPGGSIANSSPLPLTFDHTNYTFDGDECNWGAYAMVTEKNSTYGNNKKVLPANNDTYGYGSTDKRLMPDEGRHAGFMYIDASEQPGDICAIDFEGAFCPGDELMCSGWISGSNKYNDESVYRCPGGVTLTVKGENAQGKTETIYRFVPGQCYELDNGTGTDGRDGADHVVWQQFFFKFSTNKKYERYWLEVNNNCVSSNGGDFMLDNIEVYTIVPEVIPDINTPLCVSLDEDGNPVTEMRLLRLDVEFNKLLSSAKLENINSIEEANYPELGFVFLEKYKFLSAFKQALGLDVPLDTLAQYIKEGRYDHVTDKGGTYYNQYKTAFNAALLGSKTIWHSKNGAPEKGSGVLYFRWNPTFEGNTVFKFSDAVNKRGAVYRYTNPTTNVQYLVLNGNYPELPWKTGTDYYIVPTNATFDETKVEDYLYETFNLCSACSHSNEFRIEPPLSILGLDKSEDTNDYIVCEGKIPTIVLNLKGYDLDGNEVDMKDLNFDWWLGNATTLATLDKFHEQNKDITIDDVTVNVRLDQALSVLRSYYRSATSLDGIDENLMKTPNLTRYMTAYLRELVAAGELVLNQKSVSVPAKKADGDEDPYFYLVACPIHDDKFDRALNPKANQYIAYFCQEPQGLRIKVEDKAPTLKTGFVPNENGFSEYNYPTNSDPVLSIRLAKAAQFETVKHGDKSEAPVEPTTSNTSLHYLWLPIRDAKVQTTTSTGVVRKSATTEEETNDYNVYLASTNDSVWNQTIYDDMSKPAGSLPIVGKIVKLNAIDTSKISGKTEKDENRLCIYFTENFEVREGYNYTLSLPFKEAPGINTCDGTILINMKIVPDYEVWTGAAGNTDWNNDENWRRADGNTANRGRDKDELYVEHAAENSPLHGYTTNNDNYRTAKDRVFRKGFAPLYCTHVLMKSDEWGNAPQLYDAIDKTNNSTGLLQKSPFPNLRDADGWDGTTGEDATKATATPILRYDMQARLFDIWEETYGEGSTPKNKGRSGDLLAEMYQINSCDEIAFQPGTELLNAHLLNYNNAWVEYQLDNKRWYLLGSPLQGTISGEWYASTGSAKQQTTYYDPVTFGAGYDRYSPAIYQRSWDKAKAVLYEVGSTWDNLDDKQDANLGSDNEGKWSNNTSTASWLVEGGGTADEYLDRLGYKPMSGNKANVAIKGVWSNTYNDAQVDYATGGFSVMVMNHLKNNDQSGGKSIIRLPKEDTMYDYYKFSENGSANGGTDTNLSDVRGKNRAKNRGRLKTDRLLPATVTASAKTVNIKKQEKAASIYGDQRDYTRIPIHEDALTAMNTALASATFTENVAAGATATEAAANNTTSTLKYYLVENPFACGLDMDKFFEANSAKLIEKYWLLTETGQHLVQKADDDGVEEWISPSGGVFATDHKVLAPGQGFFVEAKTGVTGDIDIVFNKDMQVQSRYGVKGTGKEYTIVVGIKQFMTDKSVDVDGDGIIGEDEKVKEIVYEDDGVTPKTEPITDKVIVYEQTSDANKKYPLLARTTRGEAANDLPGMVITAKRGDDQSNALVRLRSNASNDFLPEEDTETFINSDLEQTPTVYTLCGRLATTINSIHDFRSLPVGVESTSDAPCTLTFMGVELLGDSVSFYDAVEKTLTPLVSGMQFAVSGQTQNRYYLVRSLDKKEAAEETHLQIFTEGLTAKVIASTAEPILNVRCFDTGGRLIHEATPQSQEYSFSLPMPGIYIIEAETANDNKTKKVLARR